MPHGSVTETIPAPSSEVFRLLHDYDRRLEWDTLLQDARLCDNWTDGGAALGGSGQANVGRVAEWTDNLGLDCQSEARLYCLSNVITLFWDGFESGGTARWSATVP